MRALRVCCLLLLVPATAQAHDVATSTFDARTDGRELAVTFHFDSQSIADAAARGVTSIETYLDDRFLVSNEGEACTRQAASRPRADVEPGRVVIHARWRCPRELTRLSLVSTLFHDESIPHMVIGTLHHKRALEKLFFTKAEPAKSLQLARLKQMETYSGPFRMAAPPPGAFTSRRSPPAPAPAPANTNAPRVPPPASRSPRPATLALLAALAAASLAGWLLLVRRRRASP